HNYWIMATVLVAISLLLLTVTRISCEVFLKPKAPDTNNQPIPDDWASQTIDNIPVIKQLILQINRDRHTSTLYSLINKASEQLVSPSNVINFVLGSNK